MKCERRSILKQISLLAMAAMLLFSCAFAAEKTTPPKPPDHLRLAVVNFQPIWGDKEANLKKMIAFSKEAAQNGAQMIVFPEMALTGYAMETTSGLERRDRMQVKLAEKSDGRSAQAIAAVAKETGAYIVYGYPEQVGTNPLDIYNSALAVGPQGVIGSYRKIHPFGSEVIWCKTGTEPFIFSTPWGPVGISICYDTYNYPELTRFYGASGCRLVLNPTATSWAYGAASDLKDGKPRNDGKPFQGNNTAWLNRFKARVEANVIQSGLVVATADLVGAENDKNGAFMGTCFPGGSCVVGPSDDKPETASYIDYYGTDPSKAVSEGIVYCNLDLSLAKRNSFENYIQTDVQKGNLYAPNLYAKWFKRLAEKSYTPLYAE